MNPAKVEAVMNWKQPKTITKVRSFLGLIGYYHYFMEAFTTLARTLKALTCKDHKFIWTEHYK